MGRLSSFGYVDGPRQSERMIAPPSEVGVEEILGNLVLWLKLVIEAIGALIIGIGMILASLRFARGSFPPTARDFTECRALRFARFLAIALRFSTWRRHPFHGDRT